MYHEAQKARRDRCVFLFTLSLRTNPKKYDKLRVVQKYLIQIQFTAKGENHMLIRVCPECGSSYVIRTDKRLENEWLFLCVPCNAIGKIDMFPLIEAQLPKPKGRKK
jgi:hypothetical protein